MNVPHGKRWKLLFGPAVITTGEGGDGGEGGTGEGGAGGEGGEGGDGLSSLFTPEEIEAKKTSIEAAKQEETRRAALTDEQRAEEDRLKAEADAQNSVPEKYTDFSAPKDVVLDPELTEEFKALAKTELRLSQAKAQKIIDLGAKVAQKTMDSVFVMHEERKAQWFKEAMADPEIKDDIALGGKSAAIQAFNTITGGSEKARAMVDESGFGNHPEFIRIFYRIAKIINGEHSSLNVTDTVRAIFNNTSRKAPAPSPHQEPATTGLFNHPSRKGGK